MKHRGRFSGVRYLASRVLAKELETSKTAPMRHLPSVLTKGGGEVCVVAYRGQFGEAAPPTQRAALVDIEHGEPRSVRLGYD